MLRPVLFSALLSCTNPAWAAAQQLIFDPNPGQVVDSVPLRIGMSYDDALAAVSARYEPAIDLSDTPHLAELKRIGEPGHRATLHLVEQSGRLIMIGSDWTPSDPSADAFDQRLVDLLTLLAPPGTAPGGTLACGLRRMGGPSGSNIVISEIACGRQMVHVIRGLSDGALRPGIQLITR